MHRATSSVSALKQRRRKPPPIRLGLISALGTPKPILPSSPSTGEKRKLDADTDRRSNKRARLSTTIDTTSQHSSQRLARSQPSASSSSRTRATPSQSVRSDPSEEGELPEEPPAAPVPSTSSTAVLPSEITNSNLPIRRPRRGIPSEQYLRGIAAKYDEQGRMFRYSAQKRKASTHPPTSKDYCPLASPPPVNSPYHTNGHTISRLEFLESILAFSYSAWLQDQIVNIKLQNVTQDKPKKEALQAEKKILSENFSQCFSGLMQDLHQYWSPSIAADEHERMLYGLCRMIDSTFHNRKAWLRLEHLYLYDIETWQKVKVKEEEFFKPQQSATRMLPSPEGTSSTNSTPASRSNDTPEQQKAAEDQKKKLPLLQYNEDPRLFHPTRPYFIYQHKNAEYQLITAGQRSVEAQKYLTIPAMAKYYPRTFTRMVNSSYGYADELEPDMEDDDGELMWPGQLPQGEGLAWLCTMGRAMIREYGRKFGYAGLEGVVQDPSRATR